MVPDLRRFWQTKLFWDAVLLIIGVVGTAWAFAFDASPIAKAAWATITGIATGLAPLFIGDRIKRVSGGKQLILLALLPSLLLAGCAPPATVEGFERAVASVRQSKLEAELAYRTAYTCYRRGTLPAHAMQQARDAYTYAAGIQLYRAHSLALRAVELGRELEPASLYLRPPPVLEAEVDASLPPQPPPQPGEA